MASPTPIAPNLRILVIDDNRAIHDDFRKILGEPDSDDAELIAAEAEIFGTQAPQFYTVDVASQGEEGFLMVQKAMAENRPYALAFVDMRMPPGWDGIETTRRIWDISPELQIVICTAYSDYSWDEMHQQIDPKDRLLILKKPFDTIEVLQMANALTEKWRLLQESKCKMHDLEHLVQQRTQDVEVSRSEALRMMDEAVLNSQRIEQAYQDLKREEEERRKLEEQFRDQTMQLQRAQRMESLGTLASGIAHDINNILAPILLSAFMLRQKLPAEDHEKTIGNIEVSATRGASLIKQLLTFARGVQGERVLVNMTGLMQEIQKLLQQIIPKNIEFNLKVHDGLWPIQGDVTQLHQVLLNLCVNARDAMPNGGSLTLGAMNVQIDETQAAFHSDARAGSYVCLHVIDTGEGMPPEVMEKIFDPFFTTKEIGKGTGLGLSTALGIVKGHQGFVYLRSEVNAGTSFEIYLPAEPNTLPSSVTASPLPKQSLKGRGELILVVDDEQGIREVLQKTLLCYGYQVLSASDGAEAIAQYFQHKHQIKAIVTDIMMPVMDGVTMIRALKKMDPDVRVIASSGVGLAKEKEERAVELNTLGVHTFLSKPYTAPEVLMAIGGILQH